MITETDTFPFQAPHSLSALLIAGDAGCADHTPTALAENALLLARCVAAPLQLELEAIARLASIDLSTACLRWSAATQALRRVLASETKVAVD